MMKKIHIFPKPWEVTVAWIVGYTLALVETRAQQRYVWWVGDDEMN